MTSAPSRYSTTPMTRLQYLMLRAVEAGASLSEACDEALGWGARHRDCDLFERRSYAAWQAADAEVDHGVDPGTEADAAWGVAPDAEVDHGADSGTEADAADWSWRVD